MAEKRRRARVAASNEGLQCRALTKRGTRCRAASGLVDPESGLCLFHDPGRAEQARAARNRGAQVSKARRLEQVPPADLETLDDAKLWAAWTTKAAASGLITASRALAVKGNVDLFLRSYNAAAKIKELEAQLKAAIKQLKARER